MWVLVLLVGTGIYFQWRGIEAVEEVADTTAHLEDAVDGLGGLMNEPLLVDIAEVSVNSGRYENVDGGFIQFSPIEVLNEQGEFDRFARIPVSLSEPIEVSVERVNDAVDV